MDDFRLNALIVAGSIAAAIWFVAVLVSLRNWRRAMKEVLLQKEVLFNKERVKE
jgi:hypothetical protein